ncbi:MAG: LacI family DNA-binding transcriptional regulator [Fimbriimonas sp.]
MADIARETGLTLGTVSRALNKEGKYAIAPETRERVFEVANRLGYRPNLIGRALASGKAALVLLISPDPFSRYYVEVSRHLSIHAARRGYSFVTGGTLSEPGDAEISPTDWLYGVDGIVVCDYLPHQEAHIREAMRLKIPIVALGVRYPFRGDFVQVDLQAAAQDLMRHLLTQGVKRPALMRGSGTNSDDPRAAAYLEAVEAAGIPPTVIRCQNQSPAMGRAAILEHYRRGGEIDALFCENDTLAVGAYRGLTDLGLRVPEDVLLAGCDGLDEALYQHTPITTLIQPLKRMSDLAWEMLDERIAGSAQAARTVRVAAELEIRASTSR